MPSINLLITNTAQDVWTVTVGGSGAAFTSAYPNIQVGTYGSGLFNLKGGLAYSNITVPQGATISSAILTTYGGNLVGTLTPKIYGDDQDTAGNFTASPQVKNITKTAASTNINTASGTQTHDVTTIVQEIVNRGGWSSGNGMRFGIFGAGTGAGSLNIWDFDDYSGGTAATLDITYTGGSAAYTGGGFTMDGSLFNHMLLG